MKKIFFSLLLLLSLQTVSAQGLKVVYEEVSNMYLGRDVSGDFENVKDPEIRAILENRAKSPTVFASELQVNRGVSLYKRILQPKKDETVSHENEHAKATMTSVTRLTGTSAMYMNYIDSVIVTQMNMGDKTYLLESPLPRQKKNWQITSEQTEILGYRCIKATVTLGDAAKLGDMETKPHDIVAWYCPDIPVDAGPEAYNGLPGLILKVEVDDGWFVYTAVSAEPLEPATEIPKPENGEKVSVEEFLAIVVENNAKTVEKMKRTGNEVRVIKR
jgi:GLPGLI family protein